MALGRQGERQADLMLSWAELPRSPGHAFYDRLQTILGGAGFDGFAEKECEPHYASKRGRPSIPPGRYFRMHLVGYFEGIDSERGLEWRCADSLSLREFLRLGTTEPVPDHSWLSKTRGRLPLEVHEAVFAWVLRRLVEHGLIKGDRIGVDASTMEANAALRAIVRRADGEGCHSRDGLKDLEDGAWKSRIAEKKSAGVNRWRGDAEARRAVYNNRARLRSGVAKEAFRLRAELVERSFALTLDRGGMRRAWLRGRENLKKRYLVHVAGYNLGLVMRLLVGAGTPREFLARAAAHLLLLTAGDGAVAAILIVATDTEAAILVVSVQPGPHDGSRV